MRSGTGHVAFNPPPGWPIPPPGWLPPLGWQPPQDWPEPPAGWNLLLEFPDSSSPVFTPPAHPAYLAGPRGVGVPRWPALGGPGRAPRVRVITAVLVSLFAFLLVGTIVNARSGSGEGGEGAVNVACAKAVREEIEATTATTSESPSTTPPTAGAPGARNLRTGATYDSVGYQGGGVWAIEGTYATPGSARWAFSCQVRESTTGIDVTTVEVSRLASGSW